MLLVPDYNHAPFIEIFLHNWVHVFHSNNNDSRTQHIIQNTNVYTFIQNRNEYITMNIVFTLKCRYIDHNFFLCHTQSKLQSIPPEISV